MKARWSVVILLICVSLMGPIESGCGIGGAVSQAVNATLFNSAFVKARELEPLSVVPVYPPPIHPQWTSYTNANEVNDLLRVGDELWVATSGGVLRWNLNDRTCVRYTAEHGVAGNDVRAVAVDSSGTLWFGTWGGGCEPL